MADSELREKAPWLVGLATIAVAVVTFAIILRFPGRGDDRAEGRVLVRPAAPPTVAAPAPEEAPPAEVFSLPVIPDRAAEVGESAETASAPRPAERELSSPVPPESSQDAPAEGELAALGVPTEREGLARVAHEDGFLSKVTETVLGHPKVVRFLLNNKIIVDGLLSTPVRKRACESKTALGSYLSNGKGPDGISANIRLARLMLKHPESAMEAASSDYMHRLLKCPAVVGLTHDPDALGSVFLANPAFLSLVTDPNTVRALSSDAQASSLLTATRSIDSGRK